MRGDCESHFSGGSSAGEGMGGGEAGSIKAGGGGFSGESSVTAGSPGPHCFSFLSKRSRTFQRAVFSPDRLTRVPSRRTSAESSRRVRTMEGSNGAKLTRADPRMASRVMPRARQ